jgi:hypothetical protein
LWTAEITVGRPVSRARRFEATGRDERPDRLGRLQEGWPRSDLDATMPQRSDNFTGHVPGEGVAFDLERHERPPVAIIWEAGKVKTMRPPCHPPMRRLGSM